MWNLHVLFASHNMTIEYLSSAKLCKSDSFCIETLYSIKSISTSEKIPFPMWTEFVLPTMWNEVIRLWDWSSCVYASLSRDWTVLQAYYRRTKSNFPQFSLMSLATACCWWCKLTNLSFVLAAPGTDHEPGVCTLLSWTGRWVTHKHLYRCCKYIGRKKNGTDFT